MEAPPETLAYVALLEPDQTSRPDALGVIRGSRRAKKPRNSEEATADE
jgi:hypothetical protein